MPEYEIIERDGKQYRRVKRDDLAKPEVRQALEQAASAELPEPGHKRDEVLKMRRDELEQVADTANNFVDGGVSTSLGEIKIDNEIAQWMDGQGQLKFTNPLPDHQYALIRAKARLDAPDTAVEWMKGLGWQVVSGTSPEFPEAREWLQADGTRKVGDTILLRMHNSKYVQYRLLQKKDRLARHNPEMLRGRLEDVARRNPGVLAVHTDPNDPVFDAYAKRSTANTIATQRFTQMLKDGRVPGREVKHA